MTTMAAYTELWNGDQRVRFDGTELAHTSSEHGLRGARKSRWTEITVYRTDDGKYVINKVGKSRMVHHDLDCNVLRNNTDPLPQVKIDPDEHELCRDCWHRGVSPTFGYLENDHGAVTIADGPEGAVAAMYSKDPHGVWTLTWIARDALDDAMDSDSDLEQAYLSFNVASLGRGRAR
jgi:hypothetical protein